MLEMKRAVYAKLSGDSTLSGLATIHEVAGLGQALPYIDLSDAEERDWSTKTFTGSEYFLTVHVWAASSAENLQIGERVRTLLHNASLTVTGENFILMRHESSRLFVDSDETTMHGVINFRSLTHG